MKNSNVNLRGQYYNDLSRSHFSSRTSRKLKPANQDLSLTKTRFFNRIEKACTTMSNSDIMKQLNLYRKQIERLEKELLKKDKIIFDIKTMTNYNKQLESELIETYRIIYMYEGKVSQYERQLKKLEMAMAEKAPIELGKKIEELLESYRQENGQIQGKLQQKNRIIFQLEGKLKKIENKYFNAAWKLSSANRQITNPLKKKFPNLRNTITLKQTPLLEKQKMMNQNIKKIKQQQTNEYQIIDKDKRGFVERQTIRFNRLDNRTDKLQQKAIIKEIGQRNTPLRSGQEMKFNISSNQGIVANNEYRLSSRQQSPNTQRKIYASPINRYELNRQVNEVENMISINTQSHHKLRLSGSIPPRPTQNQKILYFNY